VTIKEIVVSANKEGLLQPLINTLIHLKNVQKRNSWNKNDIVRFPYVFFLFGNRHGFTKNEAKSVLKDLENSGFIKIIPFHGVKVLVNE